MFQNTYSSFVDPWRCFCLPAGWLDAVWVFVVALNDFSGLFGMFVTTQIHVPLFSLLNGFPFVMISGGG